MAKVIPDSFHGAGPRLEIVRLMLDARADPSGCWAQAGGGSSRGSSRGPTLYLCAIQYAAYSQSTDFVRLAIERGANVKGRGGAAALSVAAGLGNLASVKLLVEAGAPLNEVPGSADDLVRSYQPALGAAVSGYHDAVVTYLESQPGAREFPQPTEFSGALSAAASVIGEDGGLTAAEQGFMTGARRGDLATVNAALSSGIQVNRLGGPDALSALMRASGWGRGDVVTALLKAGAKPDLMTNGMTALHHAAARGHADVIRQLVAAKANPNARTSGTTNDTPLFAAVKANQPAAVRALIDAGADTNIADLMETPLERAIHDAHTPVVREILKGDRSRVNVRHPSAKESPLHGALWCRNRDYNVELIQTLLGAGADTSAVDHNRDTPLKALERKRAKEEQPYYQVCYDAQLVVLKAAGAR
jgi:ankyrin repeat protein